MLDHNIFYVCSYQITKSDIRPQVKWAVSLVIADDHFNLPQLMTYMVSFLLYDPALENM